MVFMRPFANLASLKLLAGVAISAFLTHRSASRNLRLRPISKGMAGSINIAVNVAVTTFTSMRRIALLDASRRSYDAVIVVPRRLDVAHFKVIASITISALGSLFGTSRSLGFTPVANVMSQSVNVTVYVTIVAVTDMGCAL